MLQLAKEVLEELREDLTNRDVKILIDDLSPCFGDHRLLRQVFSNLVENAVKFTRESKPAEIHIGCVSGGDGTVYFVRDNGTGFDMSQSNALFQVFNRLNVSDKTEGSGVGLALVKRIVERHGGRVWADGEKGRGATFYFTVGDAPATVSASVGRA